MEQDNQENIFEIKEKDSEISKLIPDLGDIELSTTVTFTEEYKKTVFYTWYNAGKCSNEILHEIIPFPKTNYGRKPTKTTLQIWIRENFIDHAAKLDEGVEKTLDEAMIKTKVEMLQRHVELARNMQDIGLDFLANTEKDMTAASAVRLLVEGIRIERESIGIPGALEKMSDKTDEELLEELKKMLKGSEAIDDGNESEDEDD